MPGQTITVLGFDDIAPTTRSNYCLTMSRQDTRAIVRNAVQVLTERAGAGAGLQVTIRMAPKVVWRHTVCRP